ncbi:MAG: hypothetical protein LBS99_05800 [Clostridiales bacterium]|jgi:hypothetical protein|nr:hypothetical protein [Clostridiales bacterium]
MEAHGEKQGLSERGRYFLLYIALTAAIVAFSVLYYFKYRDSAANAVPPPAHGVIEYEFPRAPRPALNPGMTWELNLGGSGEDILGDVYYLNNGYYLFGTTDSYDYDFTTRAGGTANLFLAAADAGGKLNYTMIFGSGGADKFVRARLYHDGFLVLADTDSDGGGYNLYYIKYSDYSVRHVELGTPLTENALELYTESDRIIIVARNYDRLIDKSSFIVTFLDRNMNMLSSSAVTRPGSMEFLKIFPSAGGCTLVANVREGLASFVSFITVKPDTKPSYADIKIGASFRALDVAPARAGGFALFTVPASADGDAALILIASDKTKKAEYPFPLKNAEHAVIMRTNDSFLAAACGGGSDNSVQLDLDLAPITASPPALSGLGRVTAFITAPGGILILSQTPDGKKAELRALSDSLSLIYKQSFGGGTREIPIALRSAGTGAIVFTNSYGAGGDVGLNFGKADIWYFYAEI